MGKYGNIKEMEWKCNSPTVAQADDKAVQTNHTGKAMICGTLAFVDAVKLSDISQFCMALQPSLT